MGLIDKSDLIKAIRDATVYRSKIPGNWWHGQSKQLNRDEIIEIIKGQPEYTPIGCNRPGTRRNSPERG
jgi:hypothetical protein